MYLPYSAGECAPGAKSKRSRLSARFLICAADFGSASMTTAPSFSISAFDNPSVASASSLRSERVSYSISNRTSTSLGSWLSSSRRRTSAGSVMPPRRRARSISSCTMGRNSHVMCSVSSGSALDVTATVIVFGS